MNRLESTFWHLGHHSFEPLTLVLESRLPAAYWCALALCVRGMHQNPLVCQELHDVCLRLARNAHSV